MNELKVFENQEFGKVRVVKINGEPWFVGKDVADVLEYRNTKDAIARHVDDEDKLQNDGVVIYDSMGREQHPTVINYSGLYSLVLSSKLPSAKRFKHWITSEVLPSIRQTGHYSLNLGKYEALIPKDYPSALRALADEVDKNEKLQQIIDDYQPKVDYYSKILKSKDGLAVTQIAKDYGMSAYQLNKILEEEHIQYKVNGQWVLYQKIADMGYTRSETIPIIYSDGTKGSKTSTKWTQRGRLAIHEILTRRGIKAKEYLQ